MSIAIRPLCLEDQAAWAPFGPGRRQFYAATPAPARTLEAGARGREAAKALDDLFARGAGFAPWRRAP